MEAKPDVFSILVFSLSVAVSLLVHTVSKAGTNENDDGVTVTIFSNNSETHTFDLVTFDLTGENEMIGSKNVDKAVNRLKTATNEGPIILGLDCEWKPEGKSKKIQKLGRSRTALIQISCDKLCIIFRTETTSQKWLPYTLPGVRTCQILPRSLQTILEDPSFIKTGVQIKEDCRRIFRDFGVCTRSVVDLKHLRAYCTRPSEQGLARVSKSHDSVGLYFLAKHYLGIQLDKDDHLRCSDWSACVLSQSQLEYAAKDAWVGPYIAKAMLKEAKTANANVLHADTQWPLDILTKCTQLIEYNSTAAILSPSFPSSSIGRRSSANTLGNPPADTKEEVDGEQRASPPRKTHRMEVRKACLYDNCRILAPDGVMLSTCSRKKVQWYLDRGLGELVSGDVTSTTDPPVVRLFFEPKGRADAEDQYYTSDKQNNCAVCGKGTEYLRHSIVPTQYRHFFPEYMKAHISHDVLLLCMNCHLACSKFDNEFSRELAERYNAPLGGNCSRTYRDGVVKGVRSSSMALKRHKQTQLAKLRDQEIVEVAEIDSPSSFSSSSSCTTITTTAPTLTVTSKPRSRKYEAIIPPEVLRAHEDRLKEYFGVDFVSEDVLARGLALNQSVETEGWVSHGELVVRALMNCAGSHRSVVVGNMTVSSIDSESYQYQYSEEDSRTVVGEVKEVVEGVLGEDTAVVESLGAFVKQWRRRFLELMKPQHLPLYWGINSRVANSSLLQRLHAH